MEEPTLQELLRSYRAGTAPRERVMERVAGLVYGDPGHFGFDDEDAAADALERHGRRIASLADRFEDRGIAFEAYLRTSLRFLARTIRRQRRRATERELVCERALSGFEPGLGTEGSRYGPEGTPTFMRPSRGRAVPPPSAGRPRALAEPERAAFASRLVFLVLKSAWEVDDDLADRVAQASGVDSAWLGSALTQARRSLESERCRYERMESRRNGSWCRLRLLEARLRGEMDEDKRRVFLDAIDRERLRFERARAEIGAFRPVVPNSVVARILGIPKGTVDSGLYYLKKRSRAQHRPRLEEPRPKEPAFDAPSA
jgi:DNA-directed RNA polymerase specialized sigma24 family protein